jgi:hypothetical protein
VAVLAKRIVAVFVVPNAPQVFAAAFAVEAADVAVTFSQLNEDFRHFKRWLRISETATNV